MEGRDYCRGKGDFKMKAILFDLDGVITSERIYWNCAGLAIAKSLGGKLPENTREKIWIAKKLLPDDVIKGFKEAGVNSNWDIAYCASVLSKLGRNVHEFIVELNKRGYKGLDYLKLLDEIDPSEKHDRESGDWKESHKRFQACYYELADTDEPAISLKDIESTIISLRAMGLKLGIVTGRPFLEAKLPLKKWNIWGYFDPALIVTETDIAKESEKQGRHLGKPDPWSLLHAIFTHEKCEQCDIDRIKGDYILVGDSVADVLAAKNAGIKVICVRTGIASEESLRKAGAEIIVNNITNVPVEIQKLMAEGQ